MFPACLPSLPSAALAREAAQAPGAAPRAASTAPPATPGDAPLVTAILARPVQRAAAEAPNMASPSCPLALTALPFEAGTSAPRGVTLVWPPGSLKSLLEEVLAPTRADLRRKPPTRGKQSFF